MTPSWTVEIAEYIKSELGAKQLVFDGIDSNRLGGVAKLSAAELTAKQVDCFTDHFYPPKPEMVVASANAAKAAQKVYFVGEFASSTKAPELSTFLRTIERSTAVGDLYWSLFPHDDAYGFVEHADGNTCHFPGDDPDMQATMTMLRDHAYKMRGLATPPLPPPTRAPFITSAVGSMIAWRGVAMAVTYTVQRAPAAHGPWRTVCDGCATDRDTPWRDSSRGGGASAWYRVRASSSAGSGPWSAAVRAASVDRPVKTDDTRRALVFVATDKSSDTAAKSDDASAAALPRSRSRTAHARLGQRKLRELRARLAATPKPPPPPPPPCPPTLAAEAAEYGRISVKSCGAIGNHSAEQDTAAIELAMNMTKACKVSTIYFPPAHAGYSISRTIVIDTAAGGLVFQGSSGAGGWGVMPPLVIIQAYNHSRPVFLLNVRSPAQKILRASFTPSSQEIPIL